jgi:hypothetical protein
LQRFFDRDKSFISRHLNNILKSGELQRDSVVAKNATTAADGKTYQVESTLTWMRSSANWHEGKHSLLPWLEYFLGVVILGAFQEFENRTGLVAGGRGTKTAMVIDVIDRFSGDFSIGDIQERCPTVGIDMIRRVLRQERDEGKITCIGRGPQAKWRKNG